MTPDEMRGVTEAMREVTGKLEPVEIVLGESGSILIIDDGVELGRTIGIRTHVLSPFPIRTELGTDPSSTPRRHQRLSALLSKLYPTNAYERVFAEQFTDMQAEYDESIALSRKYHAQWVLIRGHLIVLKVIAEHAFSSTLGKLIRDIVK